MTRQEFITWLRAGCRAVIFDFDNVIADSEPWHCEAYTRVFASKGHRIDRDEYWLEWTSRGGGAEGEIARHSLDLDPAAIRAEKDPIYSGFCADGSIKVFPEARSIVRGFRESGYTVAIASGSYERDIRAVLAANGVDDVFAAIVGKDGITRTKPDPETYLAALARLSIPAESCLAVEDAEKGVAAAHGAGMKVLTVETAVTSGLYLGEPDLHVESLAGLLALMKDAGIGRI